MSAEPLFTGDTATPAPATPRPAGVIDLGRYRGRVGASPAVSPPGRSDDEVSGRRSALATALSAPVLVPDWGTLAEPEPEPEPEPEREPDVVTDRRPATSDDGEVVIRRVRLRSVFTMTFGFSVCAFVVVVGAGVLIWLTASALGVVENLESLAEDLGWVDVTFDGPAMLRAASIIGGILVVTSTFLSVVFGEVFNLLSTITGGLRAEVGPPGPSRRDRRRARKAQKAARRPSNR